MRLKENNKRGTPFISTPERKGWWGVEKQLALCLEAGSEPHTPLFQASLKEDNLLKIDRFGGLPAPHIHPQLTTVRSRERLYVPEMLPDRPDGE